MQACEKTMKKRAGERTKTGETSNGTLESTLKSRKERKHLWMETVVDVERSRRGNGGRTIPLPKIANGRLPFETEHKKMKIATSL